MTELADLADDEFLDELQENLALEAFEEFLGDDVVERTREALIDLKNRTAAIRDMADDPETYRRRNRFAMLMDSRLARANSALKDANRRRGNEGQIVKYAELAHRLCLELARSDKAFALDVIHLEGGLTAREWLTIREQKQGGAK